MQFQIGAMSAGDILDRGLKILFSRLPTLCAINLFILSPLLMYQLVQPSLTDRSPELALLWLLLALLLQLILSPLGTAAMVHVIAQEFIDRHAGVGDAFRFALPRFGTLLGATLMYGLVLGFGFVMCLVPVFIFLSWYALFSQAVVVEGAGAVRSLDRSKQLTQGYRLRLLGVWLLIAVAQYIVVFGLELVMQSFLPSQEIIYRQVGATRIPESVTTNYTNHVIHIVLLYLPNILLTAYLSVCLTLLYFDLRIRKEGYDLELAARQQVGIA
jgi:hypothetical protein